MATERLKVILEMVTGQYKREASAAARATDGITKSGQAADRQLTGFNKAIKGVAWAAVVTGAAKAAVELNKLGQEADAVRNRFDIVFGDSADAVADWADEVNERFGESVVTVKDLANGIADLLVPLGFTRDEAAGLTQEALTLANALSEWSGGTIEVADASERIRKALLGERESLEALGVKVLQSDVNARLAAKGQDKLTGAAKAQAEAVATLEIITSKSTDAITAYEKGANKALIKQKNLNSSFEDGKQDLADFVSEVGEEALTTMVLLKDALEKATDALNRNAGDTEDGAEAMDVFASAVGDNVVEQNRLLSIYPLLRGALIAYTRDTDDAADSSYDAADASEELADKVQQAGIRAANAAGPTGDYGQDIASIATNAPLAAVGVDAFARALRGQVDPVFRALSAVSAYDQALIDANEDGVITTEEAQNVTEAFVDLADAGTDLTETDYARFLETAATALNITEDAAEALFEDLQLLDRTEWSINLVSNLSGNTARRVEAEAEERGTPIRGFGGAVAGGRSYIVGDRGPELFTPSGSGRIIPNVGGSAGGGGVVFNNVFNVSEASSAKSVVREIREQLQRIDREVV